mmetsp:Transcript_127262/g.224046  ORF Transcript_127262/g.224046 Transcript_127262/m.224046 type:complete len:119 (-) Transcript_127262:644-1000(-)
MLKWESRKSIRDYSRPLAQRISLKVPLAVFAAAKHIRFALLWQYDGPIPLGKTSTASTRGNGNPGKPCEIFLGGWRRESVLRSHLQYSSPQNMYAAYLVYDGPTPLGNISVASTEGNG